MPNVLKIVFLRWEKTVGNLICLKEFIFLNAQIPPKPMTNINRIFFVLCGCTLARLYWYQCITCIFLTAAGCTGPACSLLQYVLWIEK